MQHVDLIPALGTLYGICISPYDKIIYQDKDRLVIVESPQTLIFIVLPQWDNTLAGR